MVLQFIAEIAQKSTEKLAPDPRMIEIMSIAPRQNGPAKVKVS